MPTQRQSCGNVTYGRTEKCTGTLPLQHIINNMDNQYSKNIRYSSAHGISLYKKDKFGVWGERRGSKLL